MNSLLGKVDINEENGRVYEQVIKSGANKDLSLKVHGVDIYQSCIDGLLPQRMLNDNIVTILIEDLCCPFTVISTFFYTVLCGEQEGRKKISRSKRNERAEMFFKPQLLEKDYLFIPINRK